MTMCDEDDFQAFVDGEHSPPERLRAVMAYLAARPEEGARMADYRRLSENLHLLYDDVLFEPLPARLSARRRRGSRGRLAPLAAGLAALLLALASGGWMLGLDGVEPEVEHPRLDTEAYDEPESLLHRLSELLGQTVYVPNLRHAGFVLRGGRLLPAAAPACLCAASAGQPAALLIYENPAAQWIAFYISASASAHHGTIGLDSEGGVRAVSWIEGPFAYALQGALNAEQLFAIAKIILQRRAVTVPPAEQKHAA